MCKRISALLISVVPLRPCEYTLISFGSTLRSLATAIPSSRPCTASHLGVLKAGRATSIPQNMAGSLALYGACFWIRGVSRKPVMSVGFMIHASN